MLEDELSVNILAYEILSINKPDALDGLDFLWRVCLVAADDVVATKAHDMMLDLTRHMPSTFQPRVLSRLSEELQNALQAMDVDSSNRTLRVQRCLQLIMNLIRGQIRICDNVFSYVQYAKSRSHGFHGYGKKITISLAAREEYKNSNSHSRTMEVGSRQALDEILSQAYPQQPPSRVAVSMDGKQLVRGANTTLEQLEVTDGAELKLELDNRPNVPQVIAFGHIGETIATQDVGFFKLFFEIMNEATGLQEMQGLAWEILMHLPSQLQDIQTVSTNRMQWRSVLCSSDAHSIWRSLYLFQIVESALENTSWRSEFLSNNGFAVAVELMEELHKLQIQALSLNSTQHANMLRVTGVPIVLRVLRLCTGGKGQVSPHVMTSPAMPRAVGKTCELIILMSSTQPAPNFVSAVVDGAEALSVFLGAVDKHDPNYHNILSSFFKPHTAADLVGLGGVDVQESSKMASHAGILVHRVLLQYPDERVRVAVADVLLEIAMSSSEFGTQLVDLMCECLNVQHSECTRCKHFFQLLKCLLTSSQPVYINEQPMKMYKAAELSTIMLQNAEKMPLSNEMMYEVISLLKHTMDRSDQTTHSQLSKPASKRVPKLSKAFLMRVPGSKPKRTTNVARTIIGTRNLVAFYLTALPASSLFLKPAPHYGFGRSSLPGTA